VLAQFAGAQIQFKNSETKLLAKLLLFLHGAVRANQKQCTTGKSLLERGGQFCVRAALSGG
jgi:pantothenate kinase